MRRLSRREVLSLALMTASAVWPVNAVSSVTPFEPGGRVWLHAHNCYPDGGRGADRLARAVSAARGPVAIEQDLVWDATRRQPVVSHGAPLGGAEPTLDDHFFRVVTPLLDRALQDARVDTWPVMVLHLDFKTNEPEHHAAVWQLLGKYQRWLTTARRVPTPAIQPFVPGPLLVLTEQGEGQEAAFHDAVPIGERLRLFGTVPVTPLPEAATVEEQLAAAFAAGPEVLIPSGATNYRRWTNHSWAVIEEGGQRRAGEWTEGDRARLDGVVRRAHDAGLWIRFYTLNGHDVNADGWSEGYNFGSLASVEARWRAAIDAGVDFVATDQYDAFAAFRR